MYGLPCPRRTGSVTGTLCSAIMTPWLLSPPPWSRRGWSSHTSRANWGGGRQNRRNQWSFSSSPTSVHSDLASASLPPFPTQILVVFPLCISCPFFFSISVFSGVTSFICVWLQLSSISSLSALPLGPRWTCWYTAEGSALTGVEKERQKHLRKKEKGRDLRITEGHSAC